MKFLYKSTILTYRYPHVIKMRVYYYPRFFKRLILKPDEEIDAETLRQLLKDYFPGLYFFDIEKNADNLDIRKYFDKKWDKWTLNIIAMSKHKSDDKKCANYACLFPKKVSHWDEDQARSKYGSADIIRFFIYEQNETFFSKISCLNRAIRFDKKSIPDKFLTEIDYYGGKDILEMWDFSGIVAHKMRHDPPSIYKAFTYYARRQYNLTGFALKDTSYNDNDPHSNNICDLINIGIKIANNAAKDYSPKTKNKQTMEEQTKFFELQQEILESVPNKGTDVPRELEKFIEQLKSRIREINKSNYTEIENKAVIKLTNKPYDKSDRKTINNLIAKIIPHLNEDEKEKMQSWTLYDKVDRLYESLTQPKFKGLYSKREIDSIRALFQKKDEPMSLDEKVNNNEDERPPILYDVTPDKKFLNPEDGVIRRLPLNEFINEFKDELGEKLNLFLELLQGYFEKYPLALHYDSDENSNAIKYPINQLFENFCSLTGLQMHEGIRKQYLVMFKRAINNIKRSVKD